MYYMVIVRGRNAREGNLALNWDEPYNITASIGKGVYTLETLGNHPIPRIWNADELKH